MKSHLKFKLFLFYNDYKTSYTTYINHARSSGLRVGGNRSTQRKPTWLKMVTTWPSHMPMTGIEHQERLMELELTSDRHPLNTSLMHIGYTSKSSLCWIRGKEVLLFVGWCNSYMWIYVWTCSWYTQLVGMSCCKCIVLITWRHLITFS